MKTKTEYERKYLLSGIPKVPFQEVFLITQFYLSDSKILRISTYFNDENSNQKVELITKEKVKGGYNIEVEENVDKFFVNIIESKKNFFPTISKIRCVFYSMNRKFEVDIFDFKDFAKNFVLLEVETKGPKDRVVLPKEIKPLVKRDVTHVKKYSNREIALKEFKNENKS